MARYPQIVSTLAAITFAVVSVAASSTEPSSFGLRISAPPGWEVRVSRGMVVGSTAPLPAEGQWIARRLSRSIGQRDIEFVLFEDDPAVTEPGTTSIYRRGGPSPFRRDDFGRPPLGGSNPGNHRFARRNFTVSGRFFDLFVESGSRGVTAANLLTLNEAVASLRIQRGDFYPGTVPAPSFSASPGWSTATSHRIQFAPETSATAVASTVRYRDHLNEFPPHRTLKVLPSDGIVIVVEFTASNRDPPLGTQNDRGQIQIAKCGGFEGMPSGVAVCPLSGLRDRQYAISGWVVYGSPHPTQRMRQRATDEVRRLVLPNWPRWP